MKDAKLSSISLWFGAILWLLIIGATAIIFRIMNPEDLYDYGSSFSAVSTGNLAIISLIILIVSFWKDENHPLKIILPSAILNGLHVVFWVIGWNSIFYAAAR